MSEDNVRTVRKGYEAFQNRDLDAFLSNHHPDVEWRSLVLEVEGVYRGHEGLRSWWENVLDVFPDWSPQVEDAHDMGDRVLVRVRAEGSGTGTGIDIDRYVWQVADVRDGRVTSSAFFRTEEEALEAAALRE
jgi:ketosteroid isomerase-like protein